MAIPSQQIGQSTTTKLLYQISKQLEYLIRVASKVGVTPPVVTTWTFTPGNVSIFPTSSTGYTLYEGGFTSYDDGYALEYVPFAGNFTVNDTDETLYKLSTNGYFTTDIEEFQINGNQQDLYLTPDQSLNDGDTQNFWYQNTVIGSKWKTSVLVYCGHCCGNPAQETPYSYILNIYKDSQYQYIETVCKTNISGNAGPESNSENSNTATQVWQSDISGNTWTLLGNGSIS